MAILGELAVNLLAKTGKFVNDMKKATKSVDKIAKSAKQAAIPLKKAGVALAAIGAAAAAAGTVKAIRFFDAQTELLDNLGKSSRRLGLTNQALQVYERAAGLAGISAETLATGLERMNDTIGDAILNPTGGAAAAFDHLGLSAERLRDAEEPLEMIQKALMGISDITTRTALTRDIFGRAGGQFGNLFEQNLRGVRTEMERMNLLVSDQLVTGVETFNDTLLTFGQRAEAAGRRVMEKLINPAITGLEKIEELTIGHEDVGPGMFQAFIQEFMRPRPIAPMFNTRFQDTGMQPVKDFILPLQRDPAIQAEANAAAAWDRFIRGTHNARRESEISI